MSDDEKPRTADAMPACERCGKDHGACAASWCGSLDSVTNEDLRTDKATCTAGDGCAIECRHCGAPPGVRCSEHRVTSEDPIVTKLRGEPVVIDEDELGPEASPEVMRARIEAAKAKLARTRAGEPIEVGPVSAEAKCTPVDDWGCEARRKLGVARGAISAAVDELKGMADETDGEMRDTFAFVIDNLEGAMQATAQPALCRESPKAPAEEDKVPDHMAAALRTIESFKPLVEAARAIANEAFDIPFADGRVQAVGTHRIEALRNAVAGYPAMSSSPKEPT